MRHARTIGIVLVLALVVAGLGLTGCDLLDGSTDSDSGASGPADSGSAKPEATTPEESPFEVGDMVAAEWDDGYLYLAEVTATDGDAVTVQYQDDDSIKTLDASDVRAITGETWEVGDRVLAVWAVARFYSGTVTAVDGDEYTVEWDDGSEPSPVSGDMIVAYEAEYAD